MSMAKVLFEGTKTFWKTKNSVQVTIVEHCEHEVLEVIVFEPAMDLEAPRLYVDVAYVIPFLVCQPGVSLNNDLVLAKLMSSFIFNRLSIAQYLPTSRKFFVEIRGGFEPQEREICAHNTVTAPLDLIPYSSGRAHAMREEERIRLVMTRLRQGLPLRGSDSGVFACVSAGKLKTELVHPLAVYISDRPVSKGEEDLRREAHALLLEPRSPFPPRRFCSPGVETLPAGFGESVGVKEATRRSQLIHRAWSAPAISDQMRSDGVNRRGETPKTSCVPTIKQKPAGGHMHGGAAHRGVGDSSMARGRTRKSFGDALAYLLGLTNPGRVVPLGVALC